MSSSKAIYKLLRNLSNKLVIAQNIHTVCRCRMCRGIVGARGGRGMEVTQSFLDETSCFCHVPSHETPQFTGWVPLKSFSLSRVLTSLPAIRILSFAMDRKQMVIMLEIFVWFFAAGGGGIFITTKLFGSSAYAPFQGFSYYNASINWNPGSPTPGI